MDNLGSPFEPDVLERLRALKKNDLAAYEKLRTELKKAGCRITALDDSIKDGDDESGPDSSQVVDL